MNKLKKLKISSQIMFDFFKSGNFKSEETIEEDIKEFIENSPKWKKKIKDIKKFGTFK